MTKEIILSNGIKVQIQDDGIVKFISSGITSFIENKKEDPRQEAMLLLAMGEIDGADAKKLASFLKENEKNHIYDYLKKKQTRA